MKVNFKSNTAISELTEDFIHRKLSKLDDFYDRIEHANVFINTDNGKVPDGIQVVVRLAIPGPDLVAESTDPILEKSVADVIEKLRRQLQKHKDKEKQQNY